MNLNRRHRQAGLSSKRRPLLALVVLSMMGALLSDRAVAQHHREKATALLERYCFDCHDDLLKKGDFDMLEWLDLEAADGTLLFENLVTGKMPPADKPQPTAEERRLLLDWLARRQPVDSTPLFRRLSRHELVHSVNDLLGTNLDLAVRIPEDRGTRNFDSDRRISLSQEMLTAYFSAVDDLLAHAFPAPGFPATSIWVTNKVRDSHQTYNIYHRPYEEGTLFSWTRANNGNSYSFFYDHFTPPVTGWYELTFDAAKVGDLEGDMSLQVYAGKYYYADDRPQPQRLVGVISLSRSELESHTIRAFLEPGESVSVHCYSPHNFRKKDPQEGIYIKQLKACGPVYDSWPPSSFARVFGALSVKAEPLKVEERSGFRTQLQRIGGEVTVSSFQEGMEKEKLQDGSHRTFWHTRFEPTVAQAPHFVILENPNGAAIEGLSYATWTGGNGNGQIKAYAVHLSDDGESWSAPFVEGALEIRLANEQLIPFPKQITSRFIKFLVTDALSLDGKSIASVGKLDVITQVTDEFPRLGVTIATDSPETLVAVLTKFAERAFSSKLGADALAPYFVAPLQHLAEDGDFLEATKLGLKAILCSPRFLMVPGEHSDQSHALAANLARVLWLSVPDDDLLALAASGKLAGDVLRDQIHRMLRDQRSERMVGSFSDQWLNLRGLNKVTPSLKLYPLYDDLLNHYLPIETRAYLRHLINENLSAAHLIDADFAFLNQRLARHYGIAGVTGQAMRKVDLPQGNARGGLLTMASVLKVTTDGFDTSPILRGAWISKNIVGTPLSPPPESVPALEPDHHEAKTLKDQIEQHKSNRTCYACHKSIDPYGFALESFDATGQWRDHYRIKQSHPGTFQYRPKGYFKRGAAVDASGEIDDSMFEDIFGLKEVLIAREREIAYNFSKKIFEYANGHPPDLTQRLHLWSFLGEDSENSRLQNLVTETLVYSMSQSTP